MRLAAGSVRQRPSSPTTMKKNVRSSSSPRRSFDRPFCTQSPTFDEPARPGSSSPRNASVPPGEKAAAATSPASSACFVGRPPFVGSDQACRRSKSPASGRRSARMPMRFPSGPQNACATSNRGSVSRLGRPPRAGTTHRLVNWSRIPTPSSRQLRSLMCRAVGFSGSPIRNRSSPVWARSATALPSGDHSAAPVGPSSASCRGSPPASGRSQGWDLPERVERKRSVFPSGENRGRTSMSPPVICSARPPVMGTRQRRVR